MTFLCFNKGTSNQEDLEDFIEDNFTTDIQQITRQEFFKQRTFIHPIVNGFLHTTTNKNVKNPTTAQNKKKQRKFSINYKAR
ncbi:hypothetical protein [uncultured Methanobrevibacter sp.]|uniref:hypothetical protein n=1 Tax=uncultured Methanobrevibacter sp. TaxID=253161 RepID=UPI0025FB2249|nr:hypothetical protein [uncultured Methanobrevibacter sp.]